MKKYALLITFLFYFGLINVNAAEFAPNECEDSNSCVAVCSYTNKFDVTRIMTIYYHFNGEWSVSYWNGIGDIGEDMYYGGTKGPNGFGNIFSSSGSPNIYWEVENIGTSNFRCPEHAFFDRNAFTEMCFSDDSETCENKSGWFATKFGKEDSGFQYDEKNYDLLHQFEVYSNTMFDGIKEDLANGKYNDLINSGNFEEEIVDSIIQESMDIFQTNVLYGNPFPTFIANSEAYQNIHNQVGTALEAAIEEAKEKAEQEHEAGNTTTEEFEDTMEALDNVDPDKAVDVAKETLDFVVRDSIGNNLGWEANSCDSILGSVNNHDAPAYYLNFAFNILKYIAIIALFVLTVLDFAKAVASSDNDALKKALQKTIKRLVICIVIFFLPRLINFILGLLGIVDDPTCGIGVN